MGTFKYFIPFEKNLAQDKSYDPLAYCKIFNLVKTDGMDIETVRKSLIAFGYSRYKANIILDSLVEHVLFAHHGDKIFPTRAKSNGNFVVLEADIVDSFSASDSTMFKILCYCKRLLGIAKGTAVLHYSALADYLGYCNRSGKNMAMFRNHLKTLNDRGCIEVDSVDIMNDGIHTNIIIREATHDDKMVRLSREDIDWFCSEWVKRHDTPIPWVV